MGEPKRIKKLRKNIISKIPHTPNDKTTKIELENHSLTYLLHDYLTWASRYVSIKKRKVAIEPEVTRDKRWLATKPNIEALLRKVRNGEDLTPHLSNKSHSKGYASKSKPDIDRWEDKDQILTTMGYHHFHLGKEKNGFRSDELLFAKVNRHEFTAVAIFDHSVFKTNVGKITPERRRMYEIFDRRATSGVPAGSVVMSPLISFSGHSLHLFGIAQDYDYLITQTDPKIDQYEYLQTFYSEAGLDMPKKPKLEWQLDFTAIGLYCKERDTFFKLREGLN